MASSEDPRLALETTEQVLRALRVVPDPDPALRELIEAIEQDRAALVAALVSGQATGRPPSRFRRGE